MSELRLDRFQTEAIASIDAGHSVLVAAPTGAGKTVIAEHAVAATLRRGSGRAFYTTPIKALSNQKYHDLVARHGPERIGLLTGDVAVNGEAPVVVMTTEVLRNMIYAGRPLDDLEFVVLDEVHFLQDAYRGPVWEEVIVHAPAHVRLVCLSATVSNTAEVADWLGTVRGATDTVIEHDRPVDLEHGYLVAERAVSELHLLPTLLDGVPNPQGERFDSDRVRGRRGGRQRRHRFHTPRREEVVARLADEGLLPAIYFIFSRAGCDEAGRRLSTSGVSFVDDGERRRIAEIVDEHLVGVDDRDLDALGHRAWRAGLDVGVAVHHAGLVPPFKEAVEECFVQGLVKVVFATETLALGINMPARSVVIENLSKFTGETHELLTPGQYTQLTGRAGRRGIDDHGDALVLWSPFVGFGQVAALAASRRFELRSAFRPTCNMAANLVRRHEPDEAHRLLNLSLAQFQADRAVVSSERRLADREEALDAARAEATCERGDVAAFLAARKRSRRAPGVPPRGIIERGLARLKPGDLIDDPGQRDQPLIVLSVAHRKKGAVRVRSLTRSARVVTMHAPDFDTEPRAWDRVDLPTPFRPNNDGFRAEVAALLVSRIDEGPDRRPEGDSVPPGPEAEDPVAACPDVERHAEALRRARRLEREVRGMRRRISEGTASLAVQFDRVLDLLTERGHLAGWRLTESGELLAGIYHESDLLVAEALWAGEFDGLEPADLAAAVSWVTYEHRSPGDPPAPWFPSVGLRDRHERLAERARSLNRAERARELDPTRPPDPTFAPVIHDWVRGDALAGLLDEDELSGGDFVRNARQVVDLCRQLGQLAPDPRTASAARQAVARIERGVVAVTSIAGEP